MSHIWYHTDRHEQRKRVTRPLFFVEVLGLALPYRRTCVPTYHGPSKRSTTVTCFRRNKSFFSDDSVPVIPGMSKKYRANIRRPDCVANMKSCLTPKVGHILKLSK